MTRDEAEKIINEKFGHPLTKDELVLELGKALYEIEGLENVCLEMGEYD